MKRLIAFCMLLVLCLGMCACGLPAPAGGYTSTEPELVVQDAGNYSGSKPNGTLTWKGEIIPIRIRFNLDTFGIYRADNRNLYIKMICTGTWEYDMVGNLCLRPYRSTSADLFGSAYPVIRLVPVE